jgi:cell division transport system permease protein
VKLTLIARKDMIELMKMVGATAAVIRRPFVIEGILKGVLASLLAGTLLTILTWVLSQRIPEVHPLSIPLLFAFVMFGAILGGFGSIASLQGYLQRWSRE